MAWFSLLNAPVFPVFICVHLWLILTRAKYWPTQWGRVPRDFLGSVVRGGSEYLYGAVNGGLRIQRYVFADGVPSLAGGEGDQPTAQGNRILAAGRDWSVLFARVHGNEQRSVFVVIRLHGKTPLGGNLHAL